MRTILITGGAGFIGSNFVHRVLEHHRDTRIVNVDALTYAGNLENLAALEGDSRHLFVRVDICDPEQIGPVFEEHRPEAVVHFAAESHVDRSITGAAAFVRTNVLGTQNLLDASQKTGVGRFVQVSTDEVYGSLGAEGAFTESSPLDPSSPYSASKAGADLLVLAAHHTLGLDAVVTRCSNNYGPYQFPEKLIPLMIANALEGKKLPIYGDGQNVRDWIHVQDHCQAVWRVLEAGRPGEVYNIGSSNEWPNLKIVKKLLSLLGKGEELIDFVPDRPGHDRRYAIDPRKMRDELGWEPEVTFDEGLRQTVAWYVSHRDWWERIRTGEYLRYYESQYGNRRDGGTGAL
jgi:dTDP-glucose 4,6-dehydratase